ncbi:hypothetical protein D3C85_1809380 [compost metagenome]
MRALIIIRGNGLVLGILISIPLKVKIICLFVHVAPLVQHIEEAVLVRQKEKKMVLCFKSLCMFHMYMMISNAPVLWR